MGKKITQHIGTTMIQKEFRAKAIGKYTTKPYS